MYFKVRSECRTGKRLDDVWLGKVRFYKRLGLDSEQVRLEKVMLCW
jgi:hypothetical protein